MTDEEKAQKLLDDILGDGKIKELLEKRFPYEFAGDQSGVDFITKQIEDAWSVRMPKSPMIAWTGRMGAINMEVSMRESFSGKKFTEKERQAIYTEVENSQIWEDGMYEIGGDPLIKYLGLEDESKPDGVIVVKDSRGIWRIEEWKNHWRTNYKVISEEEARKLIEDNDGKLIEK